MPTSSRAAAPHGIALAETSAIRFDAVSKRYRKSSDGSWTGDLRNDVSRIVRRLTGRGDEAPAELRVLDGLSFEIQRGETVALIGKNGAGKSTCLKLMSKISRPSEGEIQVRGRLAALIQLGAGFHRELSGRENVYLYAAILGLSRPQIDERYHRIVEFAELRDYMSMPLKHYSSGMQVRLGLSVAIHVDADILLIDEVLAVGDAAFRAKSADKLRQLLATRDITAILVSHDQDLLLQHCERGIYLKGGRIADDGPIDSVLEGYQRDVDKG